MAGRTRRPVKQSAYWDTSAVVPLCVVQNLTPAVQNLEAQFDVASWWATPVELNSALARLLRMNHISAAELSDALLIVSQLSSMWWVVPPSEALLAQASSLVHRFQLRAADALQLAAALAWSDNRPNGHVFLTADDKLREAARLSGFDTSHL